MELSTESFLSRLHSIRQETRCFTSWSYLVDAEASGLLDESKILSMILLTHGAVGSKHTSWLVSLPVFTVAMISKCLQCGPLGIISKFRICLKGIGVRSFFTHWHLSSPALCNVIPSDSTATVRQTASNGRIFTPVLMVRNVLPFLFGMSCGF